MPKLPSSADVQTISPRIAADPGVSAPAAAFESPLGVAAQEVAPALGKLAEVVLRQESRRDTVDRSKAINGKGTENQSKLEELRTSKDLTDKSVLGEYGEFLSQQRQGRLQAHRETGASKDSITALETRLLDVDTLWTAKAAALSTTLGKEQNIQAFESAVAPLITQVASARPRDMRQAIEQAFNDIDTQAGDMAGAFDAVELEARRSSTREDVVLSGLDSLINQDFVETAEAMLDEGGLAVEISPEAGRSLRRRIDSTRTAKNDLIGEIRDAEAILGRPLTENELLQKLGLAPKLNETQRGIQNLIDRGVSSNLSNDVIRGNVKVIGPNNLGEFFTANVATGEVTKLSEQDNKAIGGVVGTPSEPAQAPQPKQAQAPQPDKVPQEGRETIPAIEQAVLVGTGPFAKVRAGVSAFFGPFMAGALQQETTDARQQIRVFNQIAKIGLVNSPRFNQKEQDIVAELLPDIKTFFQDPDTARSDLKQMAAQLNRMKTAKEKELEGVKITTTRAGLLYDNISRINELLSLLSAPGETKPTESQERPEGIPEGFTFIGTSLRGNPVWESPDGKQRLEVVSPGQKEPAPTVPSNAPPGKPASGSTSTEL